MKPSRLSSQVEWAWTVAILLLAAWFYGWTATSAGSPLTSKLQGDDLYNRLADGFLAGHLGLAELPRPELAQLADPYDPAQNAPFAPFHDVSYFRGRYYLYFSPIPALVLLAPWKAATGTYLPQNLAVAVFAWGAAAVSVLLLRSLRSRHFPAASPWVMVAGVAVTTFGNLFPVLLRRPVFYELAIASACFFGLASLLCLHRALTSPGRGKAWLASASLLGGLAVACRPNFLFGIGGAALGYFLWAREQGESLKNWRRFTPVAYAALLPIAMVGCGLAAYNYARFGSWAEFGMRYQLSGMNQLHRVFTSPRFIPINLYFYVFAPPQFSAFFPFFQVTPFPPFSPPEGFGGEENVYGVLFALPLLWALRWLWQGLRLRWCAAAPELRAFTFIATGFAALNALLLLMTAGANNRYMPEFVTPLLPLSMAGVMAWEGHVLSWRKYAGRLAWTAALAYTVLFNVFVSFQHNELLRYHNPHAYRRLAHAFNHLSVWLGSTAPGKRGPLHVRLKLPAERTGKLEPLVVTGLSFRADFLWVYYVDDTHIKIGFEHTSYGGPVTDPIEVNFGAQHTLDVAMGSFYPPVEHPFYDGMPPERIAKLKRTLRVALDGTEVLAGDYEFYDSSPGDISVGRNPVSDSFGRRFTGEIAEVTRTEGAPRR